MHVKYSNVLKSLIIYLTLLPWVSLFQVKDVRATEELKLIVGEIIAIGSVKMQVLGNQWIELNSTTLPVFSESRIATSEGQATLSLSNKGLIELSNDTTLYVQSHERFISVKVDRGGIKFLLSPNSNTLIKTPSVTIGNESSLVLAANSNVPIFLNDSEKAGEVLVKNNGLSLINALKGNLIVTPLNSKQSTIVSPGELLQVAQLERVPLPAPIPSFEPEEGYFWGWISEKGAWEQVKLGVAPPTHSILMKDLSALPKGYVWSWDETQMRWVWLKVKDGGIVIKRIKFKDKLGNWYWKEFTKSSPIPFETSKVKAVKGQSSISAGKLLGGVAVIGAIAGAAGGGGGGGGTASPSN